MTLPDEAKIRPKSDLHDANRYFGVLPRDKDMKPMDHSHWLWGDFDDRQAFLFTAMRKFLVEPNFIVDSGRGFQTFWKLVDPMPNDLASTVMKGIARYHDGDHTHDTARIMRLPDTINQKNGQKARLVASRHTTHPWSQFLEYAEAGRDRVYKLPDISNVRPMDFDLPGWLFVLIEERLPQGERSERDFRVVCCLIDRGWDIDAIEDLMTQYPYGFGSKYLEKKGQGHKWLETTYENAKKSTSGQRSW